MAFTTHDSNHEPDDRRLHVSDLPRWPVWVWLAVATVLAMVAAAVIDEFMDAQSRDIAASALVRGVPPASFTSGR